MKPCAEIVGGVASAPLPSTTTPGWSVIAWRERSSEAARPPPSVIVAPSRVSAEAPTLIPSASESSARTTYEKRSQRLVELIAARGTCRVALPMSSANRGVPVTVTGSWNSRRTVMSSPAM